MEWQPIETYDALPRLARLGDAVFYFRAEVPNRPGYLGLSGTIQTVRTYGNRECTHWMPLPPPPKD